jgi:hypothetical protein
VQPLPSAQESRRVAQALLLAERGIFFRNQGFAKTTVEQNGEIAVASVLLSEHLFYRRRVSLLAVIQ